MSRSGISKSKTAPERNDTFRIIGLSSSINVTCGLEQIAVGSNTDGRPGATLHSASTPGSLSESFSRMDFCKKEQKFVFFDGETLENTAADGIDEAISLVERRSSSALGVTSHHPPAEVRCWNAVAACPYYY